MRTPACWALSAVIYYLNGKYWLTLLLIPSIFAFETKNPVDFTHQTVLHDHQCLVMGEKLIFSLHRCKLKATAADLLCSQNPAFSLKAKMPPLLYMGK